MSEKNRALVKAAERRQKLVNWDVNRQVKKHHVSKVTKKDIDIDAHDNVIVNVPPVEVKIDQNFA